MYVIKLEGQTVDICIYTSKSLTRIQSGLVVKFKYSKTSCIRILSISHRLSRTVYCVKFAGLQETATFA